MDDFSAAKVCLYFPKVVTYVIVVLHIIPGNFLTDHLARHTNVFKQ